MWWIALGLLLIGCASPLEQIGEVYTPQQYAVTTVLQESQLSYVVRNGEYVACQGIINGQKCTTDDLEAYGKTVEDMLDEIAEWEGFSADANCFSSSAKRICLDELNAITSYTNGTALWTIQYVK